LGARAEYDGYQLQIYVRDGWVRYTITGADWSKRYPLIVEAAANISGNGHHCLVNSMACSPFLRTGFVPKRAVQKLFLAQMRTVIAD